MKEEKNFFTLNLSNSEMENKRQVIHLELNKETNAHFYLTGIFKRNSGRVAGNYTLKKMDLVLNNICGQTYELGNLNWVGEKCVLTVFPSPKQTSKKSYKLNIELTVNGLFDFEIGYSSNLTNQDKVGIRICNIQVA